MEHIDVDSIANSAGVVGAIAVPSTDTIRTHSHNIRGGSNFVLLYKATVSSGTPDVDLYLEQGPGAPTTEGAAGDSSDGWVQVGTKLADITDESWHSVVISPQAFPFLRFRAEGQGANPASCTLNLKLSQQSSIT